MKPYGRFLPFLDYCCEGRDLYLNDGDALGIAIRDGLACAGRWWRVMLEEHCPDLFLRMLPERRGRRFRRRRRGLGKLEMIAPERSIRT